MTIEEIEARRAARRAALEEQRNEQLALDLEALDSAEVEHGDNAVARVDVPFTPGLPTLCIVKTPNRAAIKRYRDRIKPRQSRRGRDSDVDHAAAAIELCGVCLVYPDKEVFERMLDVRPGLDSQLGQIATRLSIGEEEEQGKG